MFWLLLPLLIQVTIPCQEIQTKKRPKAAASTHASLTEQGISQEKLLPPLLAPEHQYSAVPEEGEAVRTASQ